MPAGLRRLTSDRDYTAYVLRTSPVFYVPMQGSRVRELIKGVDAIVSATPPLIGTGPFPEANGYRFSASTADRDNFSIPTDPSYHPGNGAFSMGGWFNRNGAGGTFPVMLGLSTNDVGMGFGSTDDQMSLGKNGVADIWKATAAITRGRWYYGICTKLAGSTAAGFINGVAVAGTYTAQTPTATTGAPTLGLYSGVNQGDFDGWLAHWAIWNRVLTDGEIRGLYLAAGS